MSVPIPLPADRRTETDIHSVHDAQDRAGEAGPAGRHRQGSGIIVFSSSLKLLHKNRRAEELTALLTAKDAAPPSDILPASLVCNHCGLQATAT